MWAAGARVVGSPACRPGCRSPTTRANTTCRCALHRTGTGTPLPRSKRYVSRRSINVLGAIAAAAVIAAGCQAHHAAPAEREPTASAPAAQRTQRFEVVAPVLYWTTTHRQVACLAVLASLPPAGCSGVRVTRYDFKRVLKAGEAITVAGRAAWSTPSLRMVGTWNGHVFHVEHASFARASADTQPTPPRACEARIITRASRRLAWRLAEHHAALNLLEVQACRNSAWALVAVADGHTVSSIHRRFGHRVLVTGWLRPVR